eukprot:TRINITY_DN407_c2_g1_i1.p1 TRINITY_DN407_c2_g1~~TRINITY_DN407_c2_g1_i1.p1  ORF type:complete len:344 (-),score=74.89 TRINITY_DN407_c2_g1_i1:54-1046(-)
MKDHPVLPPPSLLRSLVGLSVMAFLLSLPVLFLDPLMGPQPRLVISSLFGLVVLMLGSRIIFFPDGSVFSHLVSVGFSFFPLHRVPEHRRKSLASLLFSTIISLISSLVKLLALPLLTSVLMEVPNSPTLTYAQLMVATPICATLFISNMWFLDVMGTLTELFTLGRYAFVPMNYYIFTASSLSSFWGQHYNTITSHTYKLSLYRPLQARGVSRKVAIFAVFLESALLHVYAIYCALGSEHLLPTFTFFILHGIITLLEPKLRISSLPSAVGFLWTYGIIVSTLPLYLGPMMPSVGETALEMYGEVPLAIKEGMQPVVEVVVPFMRSVFA